MEVNWDFIKYLITHNFIIYPNKKIHMMITSYYALKRSIPIIDIGG